MKVRRKKRRRRRGRPRRTKRRKRKKRRREKRGRRAKKWWVGCRVGGRCRESRRLEKIGKAIFFAKTPAKKWKREYF